MADITAQTEITTTWKNVDAALSWTDETTYMLDIVNVENAGMVYSADTDDTNEPGATIIGHPWNPGEEDAAREVTPVSGVTTWMRTDRGKATLVSTEIREE